MAEDTAFIRKAKQHKGTIAGGVGGAGIVGLLAVVYPWFSDQKDADARQWQKISAMEQRIIVLETKLDFYLGSKQPWMPSNPP